MKQYDLVRATKELHNGTVRPGDCGTILDVYGEYEAYLVEFPNPDDEDDFVVFSCSAEDIRLEQAV